MKTRIEWGHDNHPEPDSSGDAVREIIECEAGRMWMTRKGDLLEPEEMTAAHLANTIFFLRDPKRQASEHPWITTALAELRLRLSTREGVARAITEDADDVARGRLLEIAREIGCALLDSCPVCGEVVYVTGSTKDGRTIGSRGDAYLVWEKGPLGFPATPDWKYWTPAAKDGKTLAWYYPNGLPGDGEELLGEFSSLEEAQKECIKHARKTEA